MLRPGPALPLLASGLLAIPGLCLLISKIQGLVEVVAEVESLQHLDFVRQVVGSHGMIRTVLWGG